MAPFLFFNLAVFFTGAVPSAYLAGRFFKKIDIRAHGSGNVGATNAFRVLGKKIGALVFAADFLKGLLPVFLAGRVLHFPVAPEVSVVTAGSAAILGHIFNPFLGFKGGKGVATGAGVLCAISPLLFLITAGSWAAVFLSTRMVSVSSLLSLVSLIFFSVFFRSRPIFIGFFCVISILVLWAHRSNLSRIFESKENKL
ncbi:MAG: glycerol-3-phosphate 1-O-acyltransferase PlsY [Candidatus Omnitrophica bacterium]|nr:glycerol-3-phosphate 1-O-acyltransferase PlsY [Candidatus Omnitrophota bacterium]